MKAVGVIIAIALALALQTTLARFLVGGTAAIDLVLVAVTYVALTSLLTALADGSTFSWIDLDLSWLEWPDIDLSSAFDWIDFSP